MKINCCKPIVLGFIILFSYCSCKKDSKETPQNKLIKVGDCTAITETEFPRICFDSLIADCRCPGGNIVCLWQGYAQVKLSINTGMGYQSFSLSTLKNHFLPSPDTVISGYTIKLIDVLYEFNMPGNQQTKVELQVFK